MVYLPDEILEEVFCQLPVKSLVRFRCVSKSWLAVINSPYFVKLHLNRSVQTKRNLSLFMRNRHLFRANFDSLEDGGVLQPLEIDYVRLKYPHQIFFICGSCDGLLCILVIDGILDNVFLWNPSTKKSIRLPALTNDDEYFGKILIKWAYRFGYDNTNNDYKVVKLMIFKGREGVDYEIMVYSLKSNSWHKSNKFPSYRPNLPNLRSVEDSITCGAMHWISNVRSNSERKTLIVAFDLGTEKYRVIPHPELDGSHFFLYLNNLEGCLSACHYHSSVVDIFLLKEYGGKNEHWSKLITISQILPRCLSDTRIAITYSKCGKKVLIQMDYKRLVWYNLEQKSAEEIMIHGMEDFCQVYTCMESMVSLDVPEAQI